MNLVVLEGAVIRDPDERQLTSGQVVMSFDLAVSSATGPPESVPVAWPEPDRRVPVAGGLDLVVVGRVRRRFFRAGGVTQSRTEVVAARVVPVRQRARARTAVAEAVDKLAERSA
jgi:single-strand DNA-binding protein